MGFAKTPNCPACKAKGVEPYGAPDAGKEEGEQYPGCAASEPLFDKTFECPACGKTMLRFEFRGMWD
jgi:ribosomal protein L37AE/L43A